MRLSELIRTYWPNKKGCKAQTSALEMDSMNYAHDLYWALSSDLTIEAGIWKNPFQEYPARQLHAILQKEYSATQRVQRQDA